MRDGELESIAERAARPRSALGSLDWIATLLAVGVTSIALARWVPGIGATYPMPALEPAMGWALLPSWVALGYAGWRRLRGLGVVALAGCVTHAALVLMVALPASQSAAASDAPRLRFATANLYAFNGHADELAAELASLDAELIALEEVTPEWLVALERAGVMASHPHQVIEAHDDCFGIALLSRAPIVRGGIEDLEGVPMIDVDVALGGRTVRVLVAHTLPPMSADATERWSAQLGALASRVASREGPMIVTGDLNASPFGRGYRGLLEFGLRGAHESVGRGLVTTWPNGMRWLPSMRLDHVLVSGELTVIEVREGRGEGSDHRPVIATLALAE